MSSRWLNQARNNREVAQQLRQAAPRKTLEVARQAMLRYAQMLEDEAKAFEEHAFDVHVAEIAASLPRATLRLVH